MTSREFLKNLGDKGPEFFGVNEKTFARWLKSGSVPLKASDKILTALQAATTVSNQVVDDTKTKPLPEPEPQVDPVTHLPSNLDRRLPDIQVAPGHAPQVIEMSPTEQNWGINLTRPGRMQTGPLPPMKIRKENGQNVAYVEQPKPVTVLPPEMGSGEAGWNNPVEIEKPKNESGSQKTKTEILQS